jgi:hypothetical protein
MSREDSAIIEDLEDLFAWHPPPFKLATVEMGGSHTTKTRDPAWYDLHLHEKRICKRLVYVKDLHKKFAAVVDEKLQDIRDEGIVLEAPTTRGYVDKQAREEILDNKGNPMKREQSVQSYYQQVTSHFCGRVASTLALHPRRWTTVLEWMPDPIASGDAISDGSLQILYFKDTKRFRNGVTKHTGPSYVEPGLWQELMEVHRKYGDIATWEIKSLSVGDGSLMLGILIMACGKETFQWKTCRDDDHGKGKKKHNSLLPKQGMDCSETMERLGIDADALLDQSFFLDILDDDILDASLRRGGSSLDMVQIFDRKVLEEARHVEELELTSSESEDTETKEAPLDDAELEFISEEIVDRGRTITKGECAADPNNASIVWNAVQMDSGLEQGSSPKEINRNSGRLKQDLHDSCGGDGAAPPFNAASSNRGSPSSGAFPLRRYPSPRKRKPQSPQKNAVRTKRRGKMADDDRDEESKAEPPLTAQSVIQQVRPLFTTYLSLNSLTLSL